jgi:two-component system NtrC family response regulator
LVLQDFILKALIIDDKTDSGDMFLRATAHLGVEIHFAATLEEGLLACRGDDEGFDVVLMRDMVSGHASCFAIQDFRSTPLSPEILIFTEQGDPQHAEHALEGGAWDYVVDPSPEKKLPDMLRRVLRYRHNKSHSFDEKQREVREQLQDHGIIGSSSAIKNCINLVAGIAQSDASVLITGETGTGKELFTSAIHNISPRSRKNLTIVDCAALPSTLVESILFGHAKGSFTGADRTQKGLIKQADGGTLFLDEIGEMPLEIQKKFLRVLQEREYLPVGSSVTESSDFRLIAATNRDLEAMVAEGTFREDLLFRLKTFQLELPPLRTRRTDISELVYYFRNRYSKRYKLKKKKLSTDYLMTLNRYEWPGNVRELFQAVEYSMADAQESPVLEPIHLPLNIRLSVTKKKLEKLRERPAIAAEPFMVDDISLMPTIREDREKAIQVQEKQYLETLLRITGGDIKQCCETAGLSRSRLYDLLKKYGLSQNNTTLHTAEEN